MCFFLSYSYGRLNRRNTIQATPNRSGGHFPTTASGVTLGMLAHMAKLDGWLGLYYELS
jgi:hypothetical protein